MIKKILFPFFPDNAWLKKYWWHRLIKTVFLSISILGYALIILILFHFPYFDLKAYTVAPAHVYTIQDTTTGKTVSLGSNELGKEAKKMGTFNFLSDDDAGDIIFNSKDIKNNDAEKIIQATIQARPSWQESFIPDSKGQIQSEIVNNTIPLVVLVLLILLPAIIYRILLYITTNNSWKKKQP